MNCLQIVDREVEVEIVHVADIEMDLVHELRTDRRPVLAQVIRVRS